jgi:hypothetical protein
MILRLWDRLEHWWWLLDVEVLGEYASPSRRLRWAIDEWFDGRRPEGKRVWNSIREDDAA